MHFTKIISLCLLTIIFFSNLDYAQITKVSINDEYCNSLFQDYIQGRISLNNISDKVKNQGIDINLLLNLARTNPGCNYAEIERALFSSLENHENAEAILSPNGSQLVNFELMEKFDEGLPANGRNASQFGKKVAFIGDINADGYDDWAVGLEEAAIYETSKRVGKVYIYYGGTNLQNERDPDVILTGTDDGEKFGTDVSCAGDINKDGFNDFIIVSGGNSKAFLFLGGSIINSNADFVINNIKKLVCAGDVNNDGYSDLIGTNGSLSQIYYGGISFNTTPDLTIYNSGILSTAGDINGDGYDDVIIGANLFDNAQYWFASIYFGGAQMNNTIDATLSQATTGSSSYDGLNICSAGDVNDDGYDDILIGAEFDYYNGTAYIFKGGGVIENIPAATFTNQTQAANFAQSLAAAGDMNNDGYDDFVIGSTGKVFLYYGTHDINNDNDLIFQDNIGYYGPSLSGKYDLNNDGYSDLLIGFYDKDFFRGRIYAYLGSTQVNTTVDFVNTGERSGFYFGQSLAVAGDINNDGYTDIIVGSPRNNINGLLAGMAYIYFGGATVDYLADITLEGSKAEESSFGSCVASVGDINNDGYNDIAVSAYGEGYGKIYIYLGGAVMDNIPDFELSNPFSVHNYFFGGTISSAGDMNKDGFDDFVVGAAGANNAFVYLGGTVINQIPDLFLTGSIEGWVRNVSGAGDLNGDGYSDIIVAINSRNGGVVSAYFGGSTLDNTPDLIIENSNPYFGFSASIAGDVNKDGYDDVIVGDIYMNNAYIYLGGANMDNIYDINLSGGEGFGRDIASAGDINGDGYSDVLIGADSNNEKGNAAGKVYIFLGGKDMDNVRDGELFGEAAWDAFGKVAKNGGDINGDGYSDIFVGAISNSAIGYNMGRAYLYKGQPIPSAPVISSISNQTVLSDSLFDYSLNVSGYPKPILSLTKAPSEMTINSDKISWTPKKKDIGNHKVTIKAQNSEGTATSSFYIAVKELNKAPYISNPLHDLSFAEDLKDSSINLNNVFADDNVVDHLRFIFTKNTFIKVTSKINGQVFLVPDQNWFGTESIILTATDDSLKSVADTVKVTVTPVNDRPITSVDTVFVLEDSTAQFPTSDLLANDNDVEDSTVTFVNLQTPNTKGNIVFYATGNKIIYTPLKNFNGNDSFNYIIKDSDDALDTGLVIINVKSINDLPYINNHLSDISFEEDLKDSSINLKNVFADDDIDDSLRYSAADNNYINSTIRPNGQVIIVPKPNWFGTENIVFTVTDDSSKSISDTIRVAIIPVNDKPVAVKDTVYIPEDLTVNLPITEFLANDYDIEDSTVTFVNLIILNTKGEILLNEADNSISYNPLKNFSGMDLFNYVIKDSYNELDTGLVIINVNSINDPPLSFDIISPSAATGITSTEVVFKWHKSIDIDLDTVYYYLNINGILGDTSITNLTDTLFVFNGNNFFRVEGNYSWEVIAFDGIDSTFSNNELSFYIPKNIAGINLDNAIPFEYSLKQNYPNPFNPSTIIEYEIPVQSEVKVQVFDALGRSVDMLVNKEQNPGKHSLTFDASKLCSGIYFYTINANNYHQTRKMILLR